MHQLLTQTAKFLIEKMAQKNFQYSAKAREIKNAQWIVKMLAFGGTSASGGQRNNIVRFQIRAYSLAKGIYSKKGMGDKK